MRLKVFAVVLSFLFCTSIAEASEIDCHAALKVVSFLKGDWISKKPIPVELNFSSPGSFSMMGSKRTLKKEKLEVQITVLRGGSHGLYGLTLKLDDQLLPVGPSITQNLSIYGPRFASFSFEELGGKKMISYELTEPNVLIVKEQNADGTVVEVTEFSKVN